jgi:hypothetical protein
MNGRGTIVYVHGASDRQAGVADHVQRIEGQLALAGMPFDVVASHWGDAEGARLDRIEASLPAADAVTTAFPTDVVAMRALLGSGPLIELGSLAPAARGDVGPSVPPDVVWREADQLLEICRTEIGAPTETVPMPDGGTQPLGAACRMAAGVVRSSPEYAAAHASGVSELQLVAAAGRAVAATVAAGAPAPVEIVDTVQLRIAEAVLGAAGATLLARYLGIDVGPDLKRWATDVLIPHRARLMREAGLGLADVLVYQRNGEQIRRFVLGTIAEVLGTGRPVVALGNSMGGVVLVDVLSAPGAPRPDLLVTVGSQAPLLATIDALDPLGRTGSRPPFQPWLNIYDRRDFLGFVAGPVWPTERGIVDREVDPGLGFPDSHGSAYLSNPEVYRHIGEHPALTAHDEPDGRPVARRFPIRLGTLSRPVLLLFGVLEGNAYVDLDTELDAHFGFFRIHTPLDNVESWRIEGPWLWITAIGVRRGIRGDITFGGNHRGGVRLNFRKPVRWGFLSVPALYATVGDLEGFAAALSERGIPGEDARRTERAN